jgi:hypothetical protein
MTYNTRGPEIEYYRDIAFFGDKVCSCVTFERHLLKSSFQKIYRRTITWLTVKEMTTDMFHLS